MNGKDVSVISAHGLEKRLNRKAILNGLDFLVSPGELVGIVGPNGTGKTTLLRVLAGLMRADSGVIFVLGFRLPDKASEMRGKMGMLTHQPLLYGDLNAEENLHFFTRLYDVKSPHQRIREVLALVGLSTRSQDRVRTYSRGMQQRLSIARTLLHEPDLLLLDEPFNGLDVEFTGLLSNCFQRWVADGRSIVMTGHDSELMSTMATRCENLSQGRFLSQNETPMPGQNPLSGSCSDKPPERENSRHA